MGGARNTFVLSFTLVGSAINANSTGIIAVTLRGLLAGFDTVIVNKPSHQAGLGIINTRVNANNILLVEFMNATGGNITPTTESYLAFVVRHDYPDRNSVPTAIA